MGGFIEFMYSGHIPQAVGFLGMFVSFVACIVKHPRISMCAFFCSGLIWIVHYVLTDMTAALWMSVFINGRLLLGLLSPKKYLKSIVYVFSLISGIAVAYSYQGVSDVILLIGAIIGHALILYRDDGFKYRSLSIVNTLCWLAYHAAHLSYGGIINDIVQIALFLMAMYAFDQPVDEKKALTA